MSVCPKEAQGIAAALIAAVFTNFVLMTSKVMQAWNWPYFFIAGLSSMIIALGLLILMRCQDSYHLEGREVKWVVLRGSFGCLNNVLMVLALLSGAEMGSVGALGSVNTVVAALLGRVVLGEALGKWHVLAMFFAVTGAILISDPQRALSGSSSLLGNLLALLAGVSMGCVFISVRKAGNASTSMLTFSAMAQRWLMCWVLAFVPGVAEGDFHLLVESPLKSIGFFWLLLVLLYFANFLPSLCSKLCPAALSSTLLTGGQMVTGYLLDIFVFQMVPTAITVLGACLMFLAVVTMALTRLPAPEAKAPSLTLASFVASEYAERWRALVPRRRVVETVLGAQC